MGKYTFDTTEEGVLKIKVGDKYIVFNITGIELEHFEWSKIPDEIKRQLKQELYGQVSYTDAKIIVQEAKIESKKEYKELSYKDDRLPKDPEREYGTSWKGWIDFKDPKLPPLTIFGELFGDTYTSYINFIGSEEFLN